MKSTKGIRGILLLIVGFETILVGPTRRLFLTYPCISFAALGSIGVVDDKLIEVLLWSIRYEKVAAVRAEACNAVAVLGLRDERLLNVLQDRLVVETEELVKR